MTDMNRETLFDPRPVVISDEKYVNQAVEELKVSRFDNFMIQSCQGFHQSINLKIESGQNQILKDEKFIQAAFYSYLCEQVKHKVERIQLEYPHRLIQVFKESERGAPRKIDLVIKPGDTESMFLSLEMKRPSNSDTIISDVIRLTHLRYHGSYSMTPFTQKGCSRVCMVLLAGESEGVGNYNLNSRNLTNSEIEQYLSSKDPEIVGINDFLGNFSAVLLVNTVNQTDKFALKLWKLTIPVTPIIIVKNQ